MSSSGAVANQQGGVMLWLRSRPLLHTPALPSSPPHPWLPLLCTLPPTGKANGALENIYEQGRAIASRSFDKCAGMASGRERKEGKCETDIEIIGRLWHSWVLIFLFNLCSAWWLIKTSFLMLFLRVRPRVLACAVHPNSAGGLRKAARADDVLAARLSARLSQVRPSLSFGLASMTIQKAITRLLLTHKGSSNVWKKHKRLVDRYKRHKHYFAWICSSFPNSWVCFGTTKIVLMCRSLQFEGTCDLFSCQLTGILAQLWMTVLGAQDI